MLMWETVANKNKEKQGSMAFLDKKICHHKAFICHALSWHMG